MSSESSIRASGLGKRYRLGASRAPYRTLRESLASLIRRRGAERSSIWALQDVTFEIAQGEAVGVIGRNGAGKSTLLKLLSRITEPTLGRAVVIGRVGSLLEVGTGFHPELTGRENVYLNGAILGMRRSEVRRRFDEIVAFAELERFLDTPVKRYSSGMYMRLAFSVAAHLDSEVLLVDEVLAVGDASFQAKCLAKMGELGQGGRTVLFVSHNMGAVQRFCQRTLLLDGGRVTASGPTPDIVATYYRSLAQARTETVDKREVAGDMGFERWWLGLGAAGGHEQFSQRACELSFGLRVRAAVRQAYFGIAVYGADDSLIWSMRSRDQEGGFLDLAPGSYIVRFRLPVLPVRPGEYRVRVSANSTGTQHDDWFAEPMLTVLPIDETGLPPHWQGILNLTGRFELESS